MIPSVGGRAAWAGAALGATLVCLSWSHSAGAAPGRRAAVRPAATCQVLVIQGLPKPGPFPKAIAHLRSRLQGKPFSAFRSFRLLKTTSLTLSSGQKSRTAAVGRFRLEAELLSQVVSAQRRERLRFQLQLERLASRQRPAKRMLRTVLVLDRGGTLFLAGPRYQGGTLVFGLTCR